MFDMYKKEYFMHLLLLEWFLNNSNEGYRIMLVIGIVNDRLEAAWIKMLMKTTTSIIE